MRTGPVSHKLYKCKTCGDERSVATNHWGEFYERCPKCGWKHPMETQVFECQEPLPEGYEKPEPWKIVKLGEIAEIR